MRRLLAGIVDAIVDAFAYVSSNKGVFVFTIGLTLWWLAYNLFAHHPFDDASAGYPRLILIYTIVFGLYEGSIKIGQAIQGKRDREARALMQQTLEATEDLVIAIREEMDRAKERDEEIFQLHCEQVVRDGAMFTLVQKLVDALEVGCFEPIRAIKTETDGPDAD